MLQAGQGVCPGGGALQAIKGRLAPYLVQHKQQLAQSRQCPGKDFILRQPRFFVLLSSQLLIKGLQYHPGPHAQEKSAKAESGGWTWRKAVFPQHVMSLRATREAKQAIPL